MRKPKIGADRAGSRLPRLIVVADHATAGGRLPSIVDNAVAYGARAVLLRARQADPATQVSLATALRRILAPVDGLLVVAGGAGDAVHLAADQEFPQLRPSIVGRSCHDASEVAQAIIEECDYIFVSPVYPTGSKPGYGPALGPEGLAALCALDPGVPVYALGGVLPERVGECLRAGAHGVAVMGPVLRDPALVADYLSALKEVAS